MALLEGSVPEDALPEDPTPYSQLDITRKRLPVVVETDPRARWSCHACGDCCHDLTVELTPEEESRIDPSLYADILAGDDFADEAFIQADAPKVRVLRQRPDADNACIFLMSDGLCAVHARQGFASKPDACQIFPYVPLHVPGRPARIGLRLNCHTMDRSFETGAPIAEALPEVRRILKTSSAYRAPKEVDYFGTTRPIADVLDEWDAVQAALDEGLTAPVLRFVDRKLLGGRVARSAGRFAQILLERQTPQELTEDPEGLPAQVKRFSKAQAGIRAMAEGAPLPEAPPKVAGFLGQQLKNAVYGLGPLNLPDAGFGLAALMLGARAMLHTVGEKGRLPSANRAFVLFTNPVLEITANAWPYLDALSPAYAKALREELSE